MLRDREIWAFLFLIVAANTAFIGAISLEYLSMRLYWKGRFLLLALVLVLVVWAFRRWDGVWAVLAPLTVWQVSPGWFVFAALWPPSIAVVTLVGKGLLLGTGWLAEINATSEVLVRSLPTVLLAAFVGEIVWVGYAIGRLSRYASVMVASAIVGLFWSAWWLPMVVINVGVIPDIPPLALFVAMVGVAIMCGFLYAHTKSGLVVLTLQVSLNSSLLIFPTSPDSGGVPTYWAYSLVYFAGAVLLFWRFGPRPMLSLQPAPPVARA